MVTIFRVDELGEHPNMEQIQTIQRSNFVYVLDLNAGQFVVMKDRSDTQENGYLEDFPMALGDALNWEEEGDKLEELPTILGVEK